jgi:hypothetical protein
MKISDRRNKILVEAREFATANNIALTDALLIMAMADEKSGDASITDFVSVSKQKPVLPRF